MKNNKNKNNNFADFGQINKFELNIINSKPEKYNKIEEKYEPKPQPKAASNNFGDFKNFNFLNFDNIAK